MADVLRLFVEFVCLIILLEAIFPMTDAQQTEATSTGITAALADDTITVPPVRDWRSSASDALAEGRFSDWARKVLSDEDYEKWLDIDPTMGEVEDMFTSIQGEMGVSQGESRGSRRSSKRTAKR